MSYQKTNWVNGYTPLNASNMNKIEEGIFSNDTFLSSLDIRVNTLEGSIGQGGIGSVVVNGNGNALNNVSYDPSTKILNFEKNNTFALDSDLDSVNDKNLYHLGAFDSVSGNTITRQTGYLIVRGNSFSWDSDTPYSGFNGIYKGNALKDVITSVQGATSNQILVYGNNGYVGIERRNATNVDKCVCIQVGNSVAETYLMFRDTSTSTKQELIAKLNANPVQIQYKLATSYTEEIIEDKPLNTLDQSGSQWLRSEWEKGLNLLPSDYVEYNSDNTRLKQNVYLKAGTYTISFSNITMSVGSWQVVLNDSVIGTYSLTQNAITFIVSSDNTIFYLYANQPMPNAKFILNKGSHAYPYQEYKGQIVREKELNDRLNFKIFDASNSTINDVLDYIQQNYENIISIIYYAKSGGEAFGRSVIYNADEGILAYITSGLTFANVELNTDAEEGSDYIIIYKQH